MVTREPPLTRSVFAHALPAPRPGTTVTALPVDTGSSEMPTSTSRSASISAPPISTLKSHRIKVMPQPIGPATASDDFNRKVELLIDGSSQNVSTEAPTSSQTGLLALVDCATGGKSGGNGKHSGGGNTNHGGNKNKNNKNKNDNNSNNNNNAWNSFLSMFEQIWETKSWNSDTWESQTWQSQNSEIETWESESWTSAWSESDTWSSEWETSNGWTSNWWTSDSWTSDSWTSGSWTSGATDNSDDYQTMSLISESSDVSWSSDNGFSSNWSSATVSDSTGKVATTSGAATMSGYLLLTITGSAGYPIVTEVPIVK